MQTLNSLKTAKRRALPISLTPLIDVVFILLVFFMLASNFTQTRIVEIIPPIKGSQVSPQKETERTIVQVLSEQTYKIDNETYQLDDLHLRLDELRDQLILIEVTDEAQLQDVISLLDLGASLSLPNISLIPVMDGVSQ